MIRINRGTEPPELPAERRKRLSVAARHAKAGTLDRTHITGYGIIKKHLWNAQHCKCCYCERNNLEATGYDVEHFRPALRARRGTGFPTHGYWWLAWSWENIMFSCKNCNEYCKIDQFPLDALSVPLKPREFPPGRELPLLVDPCTEDPMDHIEFKQVSLGGQTHWRPFPRGRTLKGRKTIEVLKLDRPDLLDLYDRHVNDRVKPVLDRIEAQMRAGKELRVQEIWVAEILILVSLKQAFSALSYDAIMNLLPITLRLKWNLTLQRPR